MNKISIVYWTQTGNTQIMAEAIKEGIVTSGKEAQVMEVNSVTLDSLKEESIFALGCPAMGAEVLEEIEMEPFITEVEKFASGKTIALFGSYGWGDGEWMRDWTERMTQAGANVVNGEGLICQDTPDEIAIQECQELGKKIASF